MTRAIGDSAVTASNGALINPATLVSNRVVTKNAELELLIGDFVHQPPGNRPKPPVKKVVISFKVNGHDLPDLEVSPTATPGEIRKLKFPVEFLRFPVRAPLSQQPAERLNRVEVYWNTSDFVSPLGWKICGLEGREIQLRPRRVRFDAMAPIILIHGNNDCSGFFKASGNCTDGKPKLRFDFESILRAERVPYDISLSMKTNSVAIHARQMGAANSDISILRIVRSFGAKHFHVIAHSKGGLDSRAFFAALPRRDGQYAPLSLITLDSPHLGSPGADYLQVVHLGVKLGADPTTTARLSLAWAIAWQDAYDDFQWGANSDLTTMKGRAFHASNGPQLPRDMTVDDVRHKVSYYAVGADANADASVSLLGPTIAPPEDAGLGMPDNYGFISSRLYRTIGETRSVRVSVVAQMIPPSLFRVAVAEPNNQFVLNDIIVPLWSQWPGEPFVQTNGFLRNHASIAHPLVATKCLDLVHQAQPRDWSLWSLY